MLKKLLITLFSLLLICPMIGHFNVANIYADSEYKVAYIEDDGSLTTIESFSDFNSAKRKMAENEDYVVTCNASLSPSKIIAMNSGLVYSYPARRNSKTTNLYEKIDSKLNGTGVTVCVSSNYEMTYHETYSTTYSSTKGYQMGWVKVTLNGFTGYIDLEYCDLVPSKYINEKIEITLGGYPSASYSVICKQKYYSVEKNGNYFDLVLHYYLGLPKNASDHEAYGYSLHIGVAPLFMEEDKKYYSNDGINFYSDKTLSNLVGTYYNYYQFVPGRTYSAISGDTLDAYLKSKGYNSTNDSVMYGTGNDFIKDQNKYGVNGAMIYAMAIHESGYGTSEISKKKFNLFGWGAFDNNTSEATRYASVYDCVKSQMADNLSNYLDESSANYYYSMGLGNKGGGFSLKYASDPYWPEKIAQHYYAIDKFSKGNNGELTDYNRETLALVTTVGANVYVKEDLNGGTWYTTENKGTKYQKNLITVVLGKGEQFAKVRTSNNIDENGLLKPIEMPAGYIAPYNATTSYGYMKNSDLEFINTGFISLESTYKQKDVDEATLTSSATISSISLNGTTITLNGMAFLKGLDFDYRPIIKHELVIKNLATGNKASFELETSEREGFTLNDNFNYKFINFTGSADLKDIVNGQFALYIKVTNGKYSKEILLSSSADKFANINSVDDKISYRVYQNEQYGYRLQLEKFSTPFDYSIISKPSTRKSFFNLLDGFTLEKVGEDNAKLTLNAASMIYYCNYGENDDVKFTVYLVNDADKYLTLDTNLVPKPEGYGTTLSQTYDTTKIAYLGSGEVGQLEDGLYDVLVKIENGDYVDYVNATTMRDIELPSVTLSNKTISLVKDATNDRIALQIVTSNAQGE